MLAENFYKAQAVQGYVTLLDQGLDPFRRALKDCTIASLDALHATLSIRDRDDTDYDRALKAAGRDEIEKEMRRR